MKTRMLCENLAFSLRLESPEDGTNERVILTLRDPPTSRSAEVVAQVNTSTPNRIYHIREAIVIAMRRLMDDAIMLELVMLTVPTERRGVSLNLNITLPTSEEPSPSGLSMPEPFP